MSRAEFILYIVGAILASPVIVKFVEAVEKRLTRKSKKVKDCGRLLDQMSSDIDSLFTLKSELNDLKMEQKRTNILLLIATHPNSGDIPRLGEEYITAGGNSYIVPLLENWFIEQELELPEWLILAIRKRETIKGE